ncbi:MAG: ComEC family competence protein [Candidatus Pacebacteria bacterium]|nr:ComEC family competence protein [Candidatus Paceibacterota bacterium]
MMNRVVFASILGFSFGTAIASVTVWWQDIPLVVFGMFGVTFLLCALACSLFEDSKKIVWALVFIGAILLGMLRMGYVASRDMHSRAALEHFSGMRVTAIGIVDKNPDIRLDTQKIVVALESVTTKNSSEVLVQDTHILVSLNRYEKIDYGDRVQLEGVLTVPKNFVSDTGREFDYENYLAKDNIFFQMFQPDITIVDTDNGNIITERMFRIKGALVAVVNRIFPQPAGALLSGELFGEKSALGGDLQTAFRRTGVIHIVVLSGFNISIVALFIIWLLQRFLHPRVALVCGIGGIILFALLVGGGATVVRASIMAILVIIARLIGRDYDVTRGLFIAGFFMILQNPKILVFDISFQLSFLATLSLIYIAPFVERKIGWVPTHMQLRETLVQTIAAQVFVLPLLLYSIGEFSVVAIMVNILVVPLVPMTMLFGFITALVGLVSPVLAMAPFVIAYLFLKLQLVFVDWFSSLSFAAMNVPPIPLGFVLVLYGFVGLWVMWQYTKGKDTTRHDSSSKLQQILQ